MIATLSKNLGRVALLSLWSVAPVRAEPVDNEQLRKLEERQIQIEKDLAGLKARMDKKFQLLPSAKIWVTADFVIGRTAVPEFYSESLSWVIIRNGRVVLVRRAKNEMTYKLFSSSAREPGSYVVYLSTWIDDAYRPVSNVLGFEVAGKPNQTDKPAGDPSPKIKPGPSPKSTSTLSPAQSQLERLNHKIQQAEDRLVEYRAHRDQQRTLPRFLSLWMDHNQVIYRNVGPEALEDQLAWSVGGSGQLKRNARGETAFRYDVRVQGECTVMVCASDDQPLSNTLKFAIEPASTTPGENDPDNDGL